jgi:hypothetical protein
VGVIKNLTGTTNVNKDSNFRHQDKLYTKMTGKTARFRICNRFVCSYSRCGAICKLLVCILILTRILGQISLYINWDGVGTCVNVYWTHTESLSHFSLPSYHLGPCYPQNEFWGEGENITIWGGRYLYDLFLLLHDRIGVYKAFISTIEGGDQVGKYT